MKKSRDFRDVFAVFKPGSFMGDASFWEKLKYWFKNVYWYHFRTATFIAVAVVVLACMLISDILNREYNDLDYILAGSVFANTEQMGKLSDHLGSFIPIEDEDPSDEEIPTAKVGHQMLSTESVMGSGDQALAIDEYNAASIDKISVSMADDEILLFFFDRRYAEWYAKQGAFEPLSEFGIQSENTYYVSVSETPFMKELGIMHKDGIYAAIKVKNSTRAEDERILKKYDNAALALSGLLTDN
ncbi:MAG: hypothetical protein II996_03890 [Oscillospiraceae bacterium]|nr:hypothetical protein [Oscillospiraceae bacterium]MBQ4544695.1 hypothetical protein [Oscillospiraceae bacterium]MBQ6902502.1 hypothetical protein [Oscillospiraceae bacterium]